MGCCSCCGHGLCLLLSGHLHGLCSLCSPPCLHPLVCVDGILCILPCMAVLPCVDPDAQDGGSGPKLLGLGDAVFSRPITNSLHPPSPFVDSRGAVVVAVGHGLVSRGQRGERGGERVGLCHGSSSNSSSQFHQTRKRVLASGGSPVFERSLDKHIQSGRGCACRRRLDDLSRRRQQGSICRSWRRRGRGWGGAI